jgi:hypothetical protein
MSAGGAKRRRADRRNHVRAQDVPKSAMTADDGPLRTVR